MGLPRGPRPAGASGGPVGGPGESGGPHGTGRDRTDRPDRVVRVVRLGESLQTDPDLLARFAAAGAVPGQSVAVRVDPERSVWQLGGNGIVLELDRDAAGHVFVTREGTESEE
ncbi:MAG: ferrous iron transport protein A [Bifidobacteriaceae bacterium]|nr:ferrous iron transport protein A [Bifidobacteriaceae bacterium]